MVGAEAASPHPTVPSCASTRTSRFSACVMVTPAIFIGLTSGSATGMASTRLMINGARSTSSCALALASIMPLLSSVPVPKFAGICGPLSCELRFAALAAAGHAHKHAVAADEMMLQGGADMADQQHRQRDADHPVHPQKLLRQRPVLMPDRRQLEQAEHRDGRGRGGGGHPAEQALDDGQRVQRPV